MNWWLFHLILGTRHTHNCCCLSWWGLLTWFLLWWRWWGFHLRSMFWGIEGLFEPFSSQSQDKTFSDMANEGVWESKFLDSVAEHCYSGSRNWLHAMSWLTAIDHVWGIEDGGVLMIDTTYYRLRAIIYDERENTLKHGKISCNTRRIYTNYVQSLVTPRRL